jgi:hypothetical protein
MASLLDRFKFASMSGTSGKSRIEQMQLLLRQHEEKERDLAQKLEENQRLVKQLGEQIRYYQQLELQIQSNIPVLRKAVEWDVVCNTCSSKNKQQTVIIWNGSGHAIYYRKRDESTISDSQTGIGPASSLPLDIAVQHTGHQLEFHWRELGEWEREISGDGTLAKVKEELEMKSKENNKEKDQQDKTQAQRHQLPQ